LEQDEDVPSSVPCSENELGTRYTNGLGERLLLVRKTSGLTRTEYARSIGVHLNTLTRYESGERSPDAETIARICLVHKRSHSWLLTGEGPMKPGEADGRAPPDRAGPLDAELLKAVIVAVQDAARSGGYDLSPSQQAELITGVYGFIAAGPPGTPIPRSAVDHLLRAIKSEKKEKQ